MLEAAFASGSKVPIYSSMGKFLRVRVRRVLAEESEMNYYRRFVGDYAAKTAALSLAEHGAYNVLLDTYYSTESPLPADIDALCRICRAMNKTEQDAVRSVANAFFPVGEDGLRHNKRADDEVGKAQATIAKQRESGVESAKKRWSTDWSTHKDTDESTDRSAIQPPTSNHQPLTPNRQKKDFGPLQARFDEVWKRYPKRTGNNPKNKAFSAWRARLGEGFSEDDMAAGVDRYASYCDALGKTGTEFVLQAATFFGRDKPFTQEFAAPKKPENSHHASWT